MTLNYNLLGIDIDGIILDFEKTMRTFAELYDLLILKKNGVTNPEEFDYLKRYDWNEEERLYFIDNYLIPITMKTNLLPGAKEALEILKMHNYKIIIITARGFLKKETIEIVKSIFKALQIPYDEIYYGVKDKVKVCLELGIKTMIDDNPDICEKLVESNINTIYFRDKNNKILDYKLLHEVSNWGEICRYLINKNELYNQKEYEKILLRNNLQNKI